MAPAISTGGAIRKVLRTTFNNNALRVLSSSSGKMGG